MRTVLGQLQLTASDLLGHLNCTHLTGLDIQVAKGLLSKPVHWDPLLDILAERGLRHERAFIDFLNAAGYGTIKIDRVDVSDESAAATIAAMQEGHQVIVQGALRAGRWSGRADILRRVEVPSVFGGWSYEVIDTKLARETKGGTVLQICLYSELLARTQGYQPEFAYVVVPWSDYAPQTYRLADYAAYFRKAKLAIESATDGSQASETYPEQNDHCESCRWYEPCEKRRRADDQLSYVAGISRMQITELRENGVKTLASLAEMPLPMPWKPKRGASQSYEKVREQARVQATARANNDLRYELLPVVVGFGLSLLPDPSKGDIFLDLEADPFVGEHGLEYLFGYHYRDDADNPVYQGDWAFDRETERAAFERFIDFVIDRQKAYPDLHIYHFAPYEPAALKRLMGRYATREMELDNLLRGLVFVDLYSVVRNALRASVESYSIKKLEAFYGFERNVPLAAVNIAQAGLQASLELGDVASVSEADKETVRVYNQDDCVSTDALRNWLEQLRAQLIANGTLIDRPARGQDGPTEEISERQERVNTLVEKLTSGLPADPTQRSNEQQALWILANVLDWHRREDKAVWWEFFRLKALSAEELMDERSALSGLTYVGDAPTTGRLPTHRYSFPQQDTDVRAERDLREVGGEPIGKAADVSSENRTINIKKMGKTVAIHPAAVFVHEFIKEEEQADCLLRIGDYVAANGITGEGPYLAARSLLLRLPPNLSGEAIRNEGEGTLDAAIRLSRKLVNGVLPIQGPPGTGKSHAGARMICAFVAQGMKVGVTANSHKVIRNLIDKVIEAADEMGVDVRCIQKQKEKEEDKDRLIFAKDNAAVFTALVTEECQVAGGTGFLWAREEAFEALDVLVVDEAAQMSLANVLAVSHAATRLVLLGDPQQLDQPTQGTHPDGTGVSSMEHILRGHQTIAADMGLFLAETWRMSPAVCAFDSELFYEDKLHTVDGCEHQLVLSDGPVSGSGLRYVPVEHTGNKSFSIEEAGVVTQLVMTILNSNSRWIDRKRLERPIEMKDILIITPYNAQVFEIQQRLPTARVGTVDKFQGQEAPIAIYSMATSSHADAPRGMEFLYSANRFNVAVSRAQCVAILVASPAIFDPECKTPRQMQLANAFCRYRELAEPLS
jgi:uncharacterized protein